MIDQGEGIPSRTHRANFRALLSSRPSQARATGGSGLGLSRVASIVHADGGRVGLSSAPGRGATFRVEIPSATEGIESLMPAAGLEHAAKPAFRAPAPGRRRLQSACSGATPARFIGTLRSRLMRQVAVGADRARQGFPYGRPVVGLDGTLVLATSGAQILPTKQALSG